MPPNFLLGGALTGLLSSSPSSDRGDAGAGAGAGFLAGGAVGLDVNEPLRSLSLSLPTLSSSSLSSSNVYLALEAATDHQHLFFTLKEMVTKHMGLGMMP